MTTEMILKLRRFLHEGFYKFSSAIGPATCFLILLLSAAAQEDGNLTVDNLTVTKDADVYGQLNVGLAGITYISNGAVAGGGIITTDGIYRVHTFTNVGTTAFVVSGGPLVCDVLVVGGGGGGGNSFAGGGGGAGGVVLTTGFMAGIGTYSVTVGAGGGSSINYWEKGTNGTDSSFAAILAYGGGGGGAGGNGCGGGTAYNDGRNGGSGGGAGGEMSQEAGLGGTGVNGQGYAGGNASKDGPSLGGGGGGGASETGKSGTGTVAGDGGAGTNVWGNYYGGGGGAGGSYDGCTVGGLGGIGGGGDGGDSATGDPGYKGKDGLANKGGGGGGGAAVLCPPSHECEVTVGGAGGSGIVIVRYPIASVGSNITTLTISSNGIRQISASVTNVFMGKVGIGTESPEEKLHVAGDVKVEGALTLGEATRTNWPSVAEGALIASSNLSDVADPAAARANLGLGSAATNESTTFLMPTSDGSQLTGITAEQVGAVSTNAGALLAANNLSDVADAGTARSNLGLGSAATNEAAAFLSINGGTMNGAIIFPAAFGDIPMGVYTNR